MALIHPMPKSVPIINSARTTDLKVTKRGSHSLIYKSVPPTRQKSSFDLYVDRFTSSAVNSPRINMSDTKEMAKKFRAKPQTRAKVVRPDDQEISGHNGARRGTDVNGFFPSIKVRGNQSSARTLVTAPTMNFEIAPSSEMTQRYYHPQAQVPHQSPRRQARSDCSRQCSYYIHPYPNMIPDVDEIPPIGGDLSYLPRPLKLTPRRELPFVYRHKVKRNMNMLFKIMASNRAASHDQDRESPISYGSPAP